MRQLICIALMLGLMPTAHAYLDPCQALGVGCSSSSITTASIAQSSTQQNASGPGGIITPTSAATQSSVPFLVSAASRPTGMVDPVTGQVVVTQSSSASSENLHLGAPSDPKKPLTPTGPSGFAVILILLASCATLFPLFHHERHDA